MISRIRRLEIARTAEEVAFEAKALPIDPFKIAQSRQVLVQAMESTQPGISGFLMKRGDAFGIGYSTRIDNPGFINFTVGHEIGHYFLPGHVEKLFLSGSGTHASHSGFITEDPCEREADLFAATLLMPEKPFRGALRKAGEGFAAVETLARDCVTSITATAIRFAERSEDPVAVVVSSKGAVDFCSLSPALRDLSGITWPCHGDSIPSTSTTSRFQRDPQNVTAGLKEEGFSMLDEWLDGAPRLEVKEDVVGLGHYEKTLTVLFTNEAIDSEGSEEEDSFDRFQRWGKRS